MPPPPPNDDRPDGPSPDGPDPDVGPTGRRDRVVVWKCRRLCSVGRCVDEVLEEKVLEDEEASEAVARAAPRRMAGERSTFSEERGNDMLEEHGVGLGVCCVPSVVCVCVCLGMRCVRVRRWVVFFSLVAEGFAVARALTDSGKAEEGEGMGREDGPEEQEQDREGGGNCNWGWRCALARSVTRLCVCLSVRLSVCLGVSLCRAEASSWS